MTFSVPVGGVHILPGTRNSAAERFHTQSVSPPKFKNPSGAESRDGSGAPGGPRLRTGERLINFRDNSTPGPRAGVAGARARQKPSRDPAPNGWAGAGLERWRGARGAPPRPLGPPPGPPGRALLFACCASQIRRISQFPSPIRQFVWWHFQLLRPRNKAESPRYRPGGHQKKCHS